MQVGFANLTAYYHHVREIVVRRRGWEGSVPFPCWRPTRCPASLLADVIARKTPGRLLR